ncbi:MAG: radical SAM protein [bacterium]
MINPQFDRVKKLGNFSRYVPVSLPLGIGILVGYLISQRKVAKILDEQITPITEEILESYTRDLSLPYLFGISCYTASIGRGYEIAKIIKKKYPEAKVIMGGIHPTVLPEEALKKPYVDIVVRGEGEETINLLYKTLKDKEDYSKIPGISFRNSNNQIVHNPKARVFPDLNLLPPFPYHLFEKHLDRYDLGFVLSARGCPYNCIFCSQKVISGRVYRFRDPEKVIEELDLLINKYKQEYISFFDDNFVVNRERTKRLCELIYQNNFHKKAVFDCQTRGDAIDEEILHYLKMANFKTIFFGLETASERLMELINKNETVEQNKKAVRLAKKFGFHVSAAFILGLPTETREERYQSYKMAQELDVDYARFNNATPYPGTELYEITKEENRLNAGKNWENLNACGTLVEGAFASSPLSYVPATTTEKKLKRDILKINLLFWLTPRRILRLLKEGRVSGGWLILPKRWYFKPKELFFVVKLSLRVFGSFIRVLMPL